MIFENKEPDIDLLINCLIENGCTVTKAKDGEGGVYLRGKKLTDEELMDCIMRPWEDEMMNEDLVKTSPNWISVTERLPENFGHYLVWVQEPVDWTTERLSGNVEDWENFDTSHVECVFYNKDQNIWDDDDVPMNACLENVNVHAAHHVTHWMPLPESPKDSES